MFKDISLRYKSARCSTSLQQRTYVFDATNKLIWHKTQNMLPNMHDKLLTDVS